MKQNIENASRDMKSKKLQWGERECNVNEE